MSSCRILFVMRSNTVCVYSTNTGEWIRDLDEQANPTGAKIVNIQNVRNPLMLVGCTVYGDIITWNYQSGTIDKVVVSISFTINICHYFRTIEWWSFDWHFQKLRFPEKNVTVETFNVIPLDNKNTECVITWICELGHNGQTGIFNLDTGHEITPNLITLTLVTMWNATPVNKFETMIWFSGVMNTKLPSRVTS